MSWGAELIIFLSLLLALLVSGMWVPFAIGIAGLGALYMNFGVGAFNALGLITWGTLDSFTLSAIPLFILMAELLVHSGISDVYYRGLAVLVRRLPGGLLQTNIAGCALFAAISGSSIATAASIGSVAMPQLKARNYDIKMSCGSLAAGGTLGILIPPSITLIIYGSITEVSVAKLFIAGIIPGFGLAALFMLFVAARSLLNPNVAPREEEVANLAAIFTAFLRLLPFLVLIGLVLGGIYSGFTTPTEAAGVGCAFAVILCIGSGRFSISMFHRAMVSTIKISATLLFIVLAAFVFSYAVEIAGIGDSLKEFVQGMNLSSTGFLVFLVCLFALLGCILDGAGMVVLTVPLFFPVLDVYGIDPVWFGILVVILVEFGMLTPPFGLNLFVVKAISQQKLSTVVAGCVPYYGLMLLAIILLITFPALATYLPSRM